MLEGLDVCVIDDGSTDDTLNKIKSQYHNNQRVIIRSRVKQKDFLLFDILLLKEKIAIEYKEKYDWFMHLDSDEIRVSPFIGIKMQDAISYIDYVGYNAIDFSVIDFRYDIAEMPIYRDFEKNMHFFEFGKRPGHFNQVKCWKKIDEFKLAGTGGHNIKFSGMKIYPFKFLLKHYPYRNLEQANRKLYIDRAGRIEAGHKDRGWHVHYIKHMEQGVEFDIKQLIDFNKVDFFEHFLFERISGVGIERE